MYLTARISDGFFSSRSLNLPDELPSRLKVLNSWKRSLAHGVDPYKPSDNLLVSPEALQGLVEKNRILIDCAEPEMRQLFEIMGEEDPCVVLTDADGVLISSVNVAGNPRLGGNDGCALGSNWGEKIAGTNAVSLSLDEKEAFYLSSSEHFVHDGYSWTCFASPIFSVKGEVVGALALVYGREVEANAEVMALVINTARAVELTYNRLSYRPRDALDRLARDLSVLLFDPFLIIDEQLKVHFLSPPAADFFGLSSVESSGQRLKDLVPPANRQFWELVGREDKALGKSLHLTLGGAGAGCRVTASFVPLKEFEQFQKEEAERRPKALVIVFRPSEERSRARPGLASGLARFKFRDLVGQSPKFLEAVERARLIAQTDANVVLVGESGVGKDLFAQCLHNGGGRRLGPYYALNCAAIPRELLSSELFGYEEGAFTGARKGGSPGKLELANGGTLFLDEIGDMSPDLQAYLLRAIESRDIMRLGGEKVVLVDTRIICATNKDLGRAMAEGAFRADLYYRLAVTAIEIPPLRERREDIPLLAEHCLAALAPPDRPRPGWTPEFMDRLLAYDYPGNVRELRNAVERAYILASGGSLEAGFLPPAFSRPRPAAGDAEPWGQKALLERDLIRDCLERHRYNKSRAAESLGISRNNLYRKIRLYGLG